MKKLEYFKQIFRGSSAVEQLAVNQLVAGFDPCPQTKISGAVDPSPSDVLKIMKKLKPIALLELTINDNKILLVRNKMLRYACTRWYLGI